MAYEFENTMYPQLQITSVAGRVKFEAARFVTDDVALAEALQALPDWYGIALVSAPEPEPEPEPSGPPARSAPKADWVAYANRQDPGDHESMTKDELIDQYGGRADG